VRGREKIEIKQDGTRQEEQKVETETKETLREEYRYKVSRLEKRCEERWRSNERRGYERKGDLEERWDKTRQRERRDKRRTQVIK